MEGKRESHSQLINNLKLLVFFFVFFRKSFPNWIFDHGSEICGVLLLHHREILTFSLKIIFKQSSYYGETIYVHFIRTCKRLPESKLFSFILYQIYWNINSIYSNINRIYCFFFSICIC